MARWNNDKAFDYEEELRKKKEQAIVYLPEFAVKLQEKANRVYIPPPPLANSEHRLVSQVDFSLTFEIMKFFFYILVNRILNTKYWMKSDVSIN
jgi:hypothetical protein